MAPNDLESGPYEYQEKGMPAPEDDSREASSITPIPDAEDASRDPNMKDVWNKWMGKPAKKGPYLAPPLKGERHELEVFQNLVGIHFLRPGGGLLYPQDQGAKPGSPMHDIFLPSKAAARRWRNRGLYDRTLSQDMKNRVLYGMSNYIITFLYLLQILIAAALTGLSAYQQASSVALTTLGAINTVLAGVLAWLNGQGMPVRFRRARDQYREVVRAIEDTERTFAEIDYVDWAPGTRPNPYAERDRLEHMYDEARQDQERNYPDIQEGPNKNQMEKEAGALRDTVATEKSKTGAFSKALEKTKEDHKQQLKSLEKQFTEKVKQAVEEQTGNIRAKVNLEQLQKEAEEMKKNCTCGGSHAPARREPEAEQQPEPRQAPRGDPPANSPPRSRARSPVRSPVRSPANVANEPRARSPARSPPRPRSKSPQRPPVAAPVLPPVVAPARSPVRSPVSPPVLPPISSTDAPARPLSSSRPRPRQEDEPRARSPTRSPTRSPSRSRSRSPSSSPSRPSEDSLPEPSGRPKKRGPSGLFTNV